MVWLRTSIIEVSSSKPLIGFLARARSRDLHRTIYPLTRLTHIRTKFKIIEEIDELTKSHKTKNNQNCKILYKKNRTMAAKILFAEFSDPSEIPSNMSRFVMLCLEHASSLYRMSFQFVTL